MKHRGWFTLIVRVLGLWLLVGEISSAWWVVREVLTSTAENIGFAESYWRSDVIGPILTFMPHGLTIAAGCYLLFGGRWFIERCLREAESHELSGG